MTLLLACLGLSLAIIEDNRYGSAPNRLPICPRVSVR